MIAVWEDVKGLVIEPRVALHAILARRRLILPVTLGIVGYYARTLLISEVVLAPLGGVPGYLVGNVLFALGWTALIVSIVWAGARLTGGGGRWAELFALWGYTQVPFIILEVLATVVILVTPPGWTQELDVGWLMLGIAGVFLFSLWGLFLKLQAMRVWSGRFGWPFARMVVVAVVLYGAVAWVEQATLVERRLVSVEAVHAMAPAVTPFLRRRDAIVLPFDRLTYLVRSPRRGDIVSFVSGDPAGYWSWILRADPRRIGRIIGLPGDTVEVRNGHVRLNGRPLDEPYRAGTAAWGLPPRQIEPGSYFVLGDSRALAPDVYGGGVVGADRVRGRVTGIGRTRWEFIVGKGRW